MKVETYFGNDPDDLIKAYFATRSKPKVNMLKDAIKRMSERKIRTKMRIELFGSEFPVRVDINLN